MSANMTYPDYIRADMAAVRLDAKESREGQRALYDKMADARLVEYAGVAMTEKLADARSRGRGGWWVQEECSVDVLRQMLREHIDKGDMRDVMNLAAMIYVREIADATPNASTVQAPKN